MEGLEKAREKAMELYPEWSDALKVGNYEQRDAFLKGYEYANQQNNQWVSVKEGRLPEIANLEAFSSPTLRAVMTSRQKADALHELDRLLRFLKSKKH